MVINATLFWDEKEERFLEKPLILSVERHMSNKKHEVLGSLQLDLSEHVDIESDSETTKKMKLKLSEGTFKSMSVEMMVEIMVEMMIDSKFSLDRVVMLMEQSGASEDDDLEEEEDDDHEAKTSNAENDSDKSDAEQEVRHMATLPDLVLIPCKQQEQEDMVQYRRRRAPAPQRDRDPRIP
ncbi:hypothetical protein GUITHDRAFT_114443 [Guillardia theta CCMP2712]|uniref:C2 NT-type domain-containing protein n=1 Tax=Guillardia theta (strain CCMP2712) TaxID=905079 RepID=L1IUG1_GUITC|nr:hypothetical protein GUITHDRAFT_114443 [Guillardia theta CCMP2712]EKX39480.1 hypothetical protein GUITHDRAFT_114443 [Guillardia theta CCMP2712]|eukprot:XP_005826460.1 hypothetical protein GUITHDRAFT_114443 [Guillardia theta CCMP2712]